MEPESFLSLLDRTCCTELAAVCPREGQNGVETRCSSGTKIPGQRLETALPSGHKTVLTFPGWETFSRRRRALHRPANPCGLPRYLAQPALPDLHASPMISISSSTTTTSDGASPKPTALSLHCVVTKSQFFRKQLA